MKDWRFIVMLIWVFIYFMCATEAVIMLGNGNAYPLTGIVILTIILIIVAFATDR